MLPFGIRGVANIPEKGSGQYYGNVFILSILVQIMNECMMPMCGAISTLTRLQILETNPGSRLLPITSDNPLSKISKMFICLYNEKC